MIFVVY